MSNWQPSAPLNNLKKRALCLKKIRDFFYTQNIMEVETPLLCQHTVTDPHITSFSTLYNNQSYYLQTSPEYAMKRLLCAGSGSIYQICKAFRYDESGKKHNPEFTLLEWYETDRDHIQLMDNIDLLLQTVFDMPPAIKISYQDLFVAELSIDPLTCELSELKNITKKHIDTDTTSLTYDDSLNLLLTHCIEPKLGTTEPTFIYNYPPSQAALAKINTQSNPPIAERFELYIQGIEIANGFHELNNANEQYQRFTDNQKIRKKHNTIVPTIDSRFIDALTHGLPDCSGVAIGIDRLMMMFCNSHNIKEIMSFNWDNA